MYVLMYRGMYVHVCTYFRPYVGMYVYVRMNVCMYFCM